MGQGWRAKAPVSPSINPSTAALEHSIVQRNASLLIIHKSSKKLALPRIAIHLTIQLVLLHARELTTGSHSVDVEIFIQDHDWQ